MSKRGSPGQALRMGAIGSAVVLAAASFATSMAATDAGPSSEEREGMIFERQQIMDKLNRDGELLGQIAAGTASAGMLAQTTRSIANGARDSLESFRTRLPGGRAKPEVWSNHADFMQRMEAFARNSEAMAKAGETGNVVAVTALMIDGMPCKQCHDIYRAPKKP